MKQQRSPLIVLAILTCALPLAQAQVYERVDVNNQGQSANFGGTGGGGISHDGRFVVFISDATNLGGTDVLGTRDVFVRDRQLGTTTRVTTSLNASDPMQYRIAHISGDGSKIAFVLVTPTLGGPSRSFEYVLATATTTELLVAGLQEIRVEALSLDGRFASVTARTPTDPTRQVYRLDITTQALVLCSRTAAGVPAGGRNSDIDDDGTHVVFESTSPAIVPLDTNGTADIFVLDIPSLVMERASVASNGDQGNGMSILAAITGNGRFVTMSSLATNWVPGDAPGFFDVFMRDLRLGTTNLMSVTNQQSPIPMGAAEARSFPSEDATSVAFTSSHPVGPMDSPLSLDVFLRDNEVGVLLSASPGDSTGGADSFAMGITHDGREVLLFSYQQAIVAGIGPGFFVAKFGPRCSSSGYCTSLPNSTGGAASIGAQGDASRTLNNLVIAGVGLPDTAIALLVSGTSAVDPGTPFGNGLMCVGGALIRHGVHVANEGVILDAQNVNSAEYAGVNPGDTRYYQIFYRDPPAGGAQFNTTDAVAVTFCW